MTTPATEADDDFTLDSAGVAVATVYRESCDPGLPEMPAAMKERMAAREQQREQEQAAAAAVPSEDEDERLIMNPITGAVVNLDDIDSVIRACGENRQLKADLDAFDRTVREAAVAFTSGTAKTRRIQGKTLRAKVEMGDIYPNQSILKEAYAAYPKYRDGYLTISSVSLKLREFKKLENLATDDKAFESFASMLKTAHEQGSVGSARITIEE